MSALRAALFVLILPSLLAAGCKKAPPETRSASTAAADGEAGGADVKNAETQDKGAGAEAEPQVLPPGLDIPALDEYEQKVFWRVVSKEPSACGQAHSLLYSVRKDPSCRKSKTAVKYVARLVDSGLTDSEIGEALQKRYRAGAGKPIDVAQTPMKGAAGGRVVLVEFVDYSCPHCKRVQPLLRQLVDEYRSDVRLYFKHYPLPQHERSRPAAEAAVAAHKQGKFWAYNDLLWENQDSFTAAELEGYAQKLGLDVARWRKDIEASETKDRVAADREEGKRLEIASTPSLFINGRPYTDRLDMENLRDWIDEEIGR